MNYSTWEKMLAAELRGVPGNEKDDIILYYRELYGDKREHGMSDDEIIAEFGTPADCARGAFGYTPMPRAVKENNKSCAAPIKKRRFGIGRAIGFILFSLIILIPLLACYVSVLASFFSACISGGACVLAGAIFAIGGLIVGSSLVIKICAFGAGIAVLGAGSIVTVLFWIATKYLAIGFGKFVKFAFKSA